ncbi:hypothetical protein DCAR_0102090 [Daucus carota subsp. sativus]|uniref:Uncharacterized protein n=1 Tax=Daucus carota subsp. sativus TaxID=79200 RepID=A0A162B324_DAUCS|nr:hypothetical protein DCAR_0102090 [Daucus carota subsp. sativus]
MISCLSNLYHFYSKITNRLENQKRENKSGSIKKIMDYRNKGLVKVNVSRFYENDYDIGVVTGDRYGSTPSASQY